MSELKPGWKRVKFGEVVRLVKETCKDPVSEGVERVIGLEHIEPGDLRVRKWADIADGTTFTTRVRPGQVLFGKRRAYQRKVAVADFDAICSGDIYVFESADPTRLLPELLPFLCQTGGFFDHAIGTSAGSLSPRTNWTSLSEYEFQLPPIDEQKNIAKELNTIETAKESTTRALSDGECFLEALTWHLITGKSHAETRIDIKNWIHAKLPGITSIPSNWSITKLTDIARMESGHTPSRSNPEYWGGGIPWISLADIKRLGNPRINDTEFEISELGIANSSARLLPPGTVILSRDASVGYTSVTTKQMATSQHFVNFICSDKLNPLFLYFLFKGMREFWEYTAIGSTNVKTIYMPFFQKMQILLPPRNQQDTIVSNLEIAQNSIYLLRSRLLDYQNFQALVREQKLEGMS